MNTSVIVINWNGIKFLPNLINSLRSQSLNKKDYEVVIVDNNSSDESVSYIEKNYPEAVLVKHHSNSGFAEGCNIGFKYSSGEYLVLINNDMELDNNWLKSLVKTADNSALTVGGVVSKVLFKNKPGYINNAGSILQPLNEWPVSDRGFMEKDGPLYGKLDEVSAFCGASVLLKRSMLKQIGIFDQSFFMYFEDADLSWRGTKHGWKYLYQPASIAHHEHTGSSKEGSEFFTFHVARNRLVILLKHSSKKVFVKVLRETFTERIIRPTKIFLSRNAERSQAARDLRLGIKILFSFCLRAPAALLHRYNLLDEKRI